VIAKTVDPICLALVEVARPGPIVGEALHPLNLIGGEAAHPTVGDQSVPVGLADSA